MAKEETYFLNRPVVFTELGNTRLPAETKIIIKTSDTPPHDVVALTPNGQRHEFKSNHVMSLLKTPWVNKDAASAVPKPPPQLPTPPVQKPSDELVNFGAGGSFDSTPARVDVTGILDKPAAEVAVVAVPEAAPTPDAPEAPVETTAEVVAEALAPSAEASEAPAAEPAVEAAAPAPKKPAKGKKSE